MEQLKRRGNALYKKKKIDDAIQAYDEALNVPFVAPGKLNHYDEEARQEEKRIQELRCAIFANRAACYLQKGRLTECIQDATNALRSNGNYVKALYRRAQAYAELGNLRDAFQDLRRALDLDPFNQEIIREAHRVRESIQRSEAERQSSGISVYLASLGTNDEVFFKKENRTEMWERLISLVGKNAIAAADFSKQGGLSFLEARAKKGDAKERALALRLLAACSKHLDFLEDAFSPPSNETICETSFPKLFTSLLPSHEKQKIGVEEKAVLEIATNFIRLAETNRRRTQFLTLAIDCWITLLTHRRETFQEIGLASLLSWSANCLNERDQSLSLLLAKPSWTTLQRLLEDPNDSYTICLRLEAAEFIGRAFMVLLFHKGSDEVKSFVSSILDNSVNELPARAERITIGMSTKINRRNSIPALCGKTLYGVAFSMASLTLNNEEIKTDALQERGIALDEYENIQRILRMQQKQTAIEEDLDTVDSAQDVEKRIRELVQRNVIGIIRRLVSHTEISESTLDQFATALLKIATIPALRGQFIQDGGYNTCLGLAKENRGLEVTRLKSVQALAKCLITTDPKILASHQRTAPIHALVSLCRNVRATALQQFESSLALTNLASYGKECIDSIALNGGIESFFSLQFSEQTLVRRAATEALCNMVSHPLVLAKLGKPETLKYWLSLAEDYTRDLPLSRAAAGGLAMASNDEEIVRSMAVLSPIALNTWGLLLRSGETTLIHRAATAIQNLLSFNCTRELLFNDENFQNSLREAANIDHLSEEIGDLIRLASSQFPRN
ncbi:hypothetical protein NSK_004331 [Nannochloropsis salina CCMP1776]|uniref:Protein unc-45 homolog B n=1 Tax=Nannochloropsis salina CCMP1776 TaxID=1027361 RepID=A0A4D9CY68_9STRA|nr:hypothetical protein NSK_004331 [Nannochloropsis salina CCMP1776]|eukprot:TFJ84341.1 hypothetical protein NSK_004331 [Nannochloropsis salina CCMP1776]